MPARPAPEPVRPGLLLAAFGAYSLAHLANQTLLARPEAVRALEELRSASGGWVEPLLVRSLVVLAAFLLVVVVLGARAPRDVGWRAPHVLPGVAVTLGAWAVLQLGLALAVLARGAALAPHPEWAHRGVVPVAAAVLAQALGPALVEDTAFRGFFLPQLRRRIARPGTLALLAAAGALAGSALLFGLAHLPARALVARSDLLALAREQAHLVSAGLALGLVALATRNLFVVVGLHVLLVEPATLVAAPAEWVRTGVLCVFGVVVVGALAWRVRRRGRGSVREVRVGRRAA
jgi:membrane protease YdiL (CAAX protease family)